MSVPKVVVIILAYEYSPETLECIDSVGKVAYSNFGIVLVDNGSTSLPHDELKARYPALTILRNDRNLGYAAGNNVGLGFALEAGAAYSLLLNDDTIVSAEFLTLLVEAGEREPQAAFLGPMVYHYDEPHVIQSAGGLRTRNWRFYHRGLNELDAGQYRTTEAVLWVTGCAIMARSSALERIGLMDEDFFSYSEEVDWCLRASEAGYKVLFVPEAKIWHRGVQRDYNPSPLITYLSARNELHLLAKHRAGPAALTSTLLRHLRTLTSWSVRPRWRDRWQHRDALARALRDFMQGRIGPPPVAF